MYVGQSIEILPFVHLTYMTNTGIAFSMFQRANTVFIGFTVLALIGMAVWFIRQKGFQRGFLSTAVLLIFSGACGNVIDRVFRGAVVDFIDVSIGSYHWPAFNVADSCISIGGVILCILLIRTDNASHSL
jgi:signal peptidase II